MIVTGCPSIAVMWSFGRKPALRAGLPPSVPATITPVSYGKRMLRLKSLSGWNLMPNQLHHALPFVRRYGRISRIAVEGIVNACPPNITPRAFRPTTCPAVSTSGPPELPGEIAASV